MANRCVAVKMLKWAARGIWAFTQVAFVVVLVIAALGWIIATPEREAIFELVCGIIAGALVLILFVGIVLAIVEDGREKLREFKAKCGRER